MMENDEDVLTAEADHTEEESEEDRGGRSPTEISMPSAAPSPTSVQHTVSSTYAGEEAEEEKKFTPVQLEVPETGDAVVDSQGEVAFVSVKVDQETEDGRQCTCGIRYLNGDYAEVYVKNIKKLIGADSVELAKRAREGVLQKNYAEGYVKDPKRLRNEDLVELGKSAREEMLQKKNARKDAKNEEKKRKAAEERKEAQERAAAELKEAQEKEEAEGRTEERRRQKKENKERKDRKPKEARKARSGAEDEDAKDEEKPEERRRQEKPEASRRSLKQERKNPRKKRARSGAERHRTGGEDSRSQECSRASGRCRREGEADR